ncbi:MalY/PatB family protein [Scatolibacter rhodanostii]|uniref:MalY/PatB family protein n=1 Tax=Scatolibacter rhodanostii TaxID=2014781 RepID=UPI000C074FAB|nr:MalY/PatB family protein [Scatolibacter rhodanostii]
MPYDFETLVSRKNTGSSKWNSMYNSVKDELSDDIIPFSIADMDLKHPPQITKALQNYVAENILGYTHPHPAYTDAVCHWMKTRHNWEVEAEWIIPFPGIVPAVYGIVRTFTEPDDGIIIMPPVYYPFYSAISSNGRKTVENLLIDNNGHYEIDFADLEEKAKDPKNTMLIFCSPHNPVGRVWTPEELEKVGQICLDNHVLLVSDEIHFDLVMPGYHHTVLSTVNPAFAANTIVCTAPTKTFNLAGLNVSNLVIQNDTLRSKFKNYIESLGQIGVNALGLKACQVAYTECADWLDNLIALLDTNKKLCENFMKEHIPQIEVRTLEGTYLQWWDCRKLNLSEKELEKLNQEKAFLFLDEGYIFGKSGSGFERINLACPTAYIEKALLRLEKALEN